MREVRKQVNASIVDPAFIVAVRKKLDLDQREAAEIFGGGVNVFARHENGKTKLPLALVKLPKATPKDYRVARGHSAWNFSEGDSGAGKYFPDSWDDRHISDSRTVHGG